MREAPLCKGSWHGEAVTEGLCGEMLCICIKLGEYRKSSFTAIPIFQCSLLL